VGVVGRVSERVAGHYVYGVNVAVSLASIDASETATFLKMDISLPETC
jgi:hypothetical protein